MYQCQLVQSFDTAATTDRGLQDMDLTEPTVESGGVEGGNTAEGVDFSA